jgi:alkanesulfonate monooxygenase SsuD/methylene tetrahydromethanopterin reductase-like flavin-dependent oxidoreductase (luciferase family)
VRPFSFGVRLRAERHLPSAHDSVVALLTLARVAEEEGCAAFLLAPGSDATTSFDPFVVLGAAAAETERELLGCVAIAVEERHPSLLAKALASLDTCSRGRALACLALAESAGDDAVGELAESLAIVRAMLEVPGASFAGEHWSIFGAWNEPRVEHHGPFPLGVLIEGTDVATASAELLVALAEHARFVVSRFSGDQVPADVVPHVALIEIGEDSDVHGSADLCALARERGFASSVLDWRSPPSPERLTATITTVREAL